MAATFHSMSQASLESLLANGSIVSGDLYYATDTQTLYLACTNTAGGVGIAPTNMMLTGAITLGFNGAQGPAGTPGAAGSNGPTGAVGPAGQGVNYTDGVPWFDVTAFGASGSQETTTGSITEGTAILNLAAAKDFLNGQGVLVYGAGPAPSVSTPTGGAIATQGTTGSTAYQYQISALEENGGESAACALLETSQGNGTLGGSASDTVASFTRTGTTIAVVLANGIPGLAVGNVVFISTGFSAGNWTINGWFEITASADDKHFSFVYASQAYYPNASVSNPGTITVTLYNGNVLSWSAVSGASRYIVFGRTSGSYGYVGFTNQTFYLDYGQASEAIPAWLLGHVAPSSPVNDWLVASIVSGGGTTQLTLSANAGATVSNLNVQHDDTSAVNAALAAATTSPIGGSVYFRTAAGYNLGTINVPTHAFKWFKILFGADCFMYGPWVPASFTQLEGLGGSGGTSFALGSAARILPMAGSDTPLLILNAITSLNITNLSFQGSQYFADVVLQPNTSGGAGSNYIRLVQSSFIANNGTGIPWKITANTALTPTGFGLWASATVFGNNYATNGGLPNNPIAQSSLFMQNFGIVAIDGGSFFDGYGIQAPNSGSPNVSQFHLSDILFESGLTDFLSSCAAWGFHLEQVQLADAQRAINPIFVFGTSSSMEDVQVDGVDCSTVINTYSEGHLAGLYQTNGSSAIPVDPSAVNFWSRFSYGSSVNTSGFLTISVPQPFTALLVKTGNALLQRYKATGTAYSGVDAAIGLGAGWGSTGAVSAAAGYDQGFSFTVTPGGSGIAAGAVITITFKDGTWTNPPQFLVVRNDANSPYGTPPHTISVSATQLVITFNGTVSGGVAYKFICLAVGN